MSENVGASTSRNIKGLHGLYRDNFTVTFRGQDLKTGWGEIFQVASNISEHGFGLRPFYTDDASSVRNSFSVTGDTTCKTMSLSQTFSPISP
jgi:hypothetical protein